MELILHNRVIDGDVFDILTEIRNASNIEFLKEVGRNGDNIKCTCPFHKGGQENKPSAYVYNKQDNDKIPFGLLHCFTCGKKASLVEVVEKCLGLSTEAAEDWLVSKYASSYLIEQNGYDLPEIVLDAPSKKEYIDESILDQFAFMHPYHFQRGLSEEVIKAFKLGYNKETNSVTFPVWDDKNHLVGITERSVSNKRYHIPAGMDKPVYLLNFIKQWNITDVIVCESQINALTCWSWGYPAIALFGTGTKSQYELLSRSGIRVFHLALDGDLAGRTGTLKLINNLPDWAIVDVIGIPNGKDVNDLTKEEFDSLNRVDKNNFE